MLLLTLNAWGETTWWVYNPEDPRSQYHRGTNFRRGGNLNVGAGPNKSSTLNPKPAVTQCERRVSPVAYSSNQSPDARIPHAWSNDVCPLGWGLVRQSSRVPSLQVASFYRHGTMFSSTVEKETQSSLILVGILRCSAGTHIHSSERWWGHVHIHRCDLRFVSLYNGDI